MVWAGLGSGVAHAVTIPPFPTSPLRVEFPVGDSAEVFVPLPGLCKDDGFLKAQVGSPVFDGTAHVVTHVELVATCDAAAGVVVRVTSDEPLTGLVSVTVVSIQGRNPDSSDVVAETGPFTVEFYMGIPIPDTGANTLRLSLWALVAVAAGATLVAGSRRRRVA